MDPDDLLIPVAAWSALAGRFAWTDRPVLASPHAEDLRALKGLSRVLGRLGRTAQIRRQGFGPCQLQIRRDRRIETGEGARIEIASDRIQVTSRTGAGAFYAIQTLCQLTAGRGDGSLPACRIEDRPALPRRGVYHDISRGKVPTLQTLKQLVETLSAWKINELQLYVENVFRFDRHPEIGRGYDPLSPGDVLELQDHCRAHHVRLVGSLATFGHMERILQLPACRHLAELPGYRDWPGGTTLCPTDPGSLELVGELMEEFVPLFAAEDFNVCGDEPWELGLGRSRAAADQRGKGRLYLDFMSEVCRICRNLGKRPNLWSDIVLDHGELLDQWDRDVVMLNWDYHPDGARMARSRQLAAAGLEWLACPGTNAWNSHGGRLEMGRQNILRFARQADSLGAAGLVNTDWGDNGHRNMLAVSLANLAVGAAAAWCPDKAAAVENFPERFVAQGLQSGRPGLAEAIRTLGAAHEQLGLEWGNDTLTYFTLSRPAEEFVPAQAPRGPALDAVATDALIDRIERLEALDFAADDEPDPVLADTLAEYALATRQEIVACHRAVVLQALRAGDPPPPEHLRALLQRGRRLLEELPEIWARRNRPSRLTTQMAMLQAALEQAGSLRT